MDPTVPTPQAATSIELEDAFDDDSLEMNAAGTKFRVGNVAGKLGVLADPQTPAAHAHPAATPSTAGFLAAADKTKLDTLAPGQAGALGTVTADAFLEVPTNIPYAANVTLDAAAKNDYTIGQLTGPCAITWANPGAGRQGTVTVRQDATGNRAVTLTAPGGWTLQRDSLLSDLAAAQAANAITLYTWVFVSVGGANILLCSKVMGA